MWRLIDAMELSKVSLEIIDKYLHSTKEDLQVIDILISMKTWEYLPFFPAEFKNLGSSVTNLYRIKDALNEYFNERQYPFKAYCNPHNASYIGSNRDRK